MPGSRTVAALIVAASAGALAVAFAAEHLGGLVPCPLCLWQRWPYGAAIVVGALAFAFAGRGRWPAALVGLAGAVFAGEAALAFYHVGVEAGWFEGLAACANAATPDSVEALRDQLLETPPPPPCDEPAWTLFGISMAGYNMLYAAALAAATLAAAVAMARERTT